MMGVVVLVNGTNKKGTKWPFALFAISTGIWALFISLFAFSLDVAVARVYVDVYYISALFIGYSFMLFSVFYSGIAVSRAVLFSALIPWVAMSILIALPSFFVGAIEIGAARNVELIRPLYVIYTILFVAYVLIGMGMLWWKAFRSRRKEGHRLVLAVSLTICFLGGALFNLFLPLGGIYSLIALGPLFSFLLVASVFYAIARHRLFDIRLAVIRTTTYLLTLGTLAGVYLIVVFVVFDQLLGQASTLDQTLLNVSLTLLLAFVFQPIKQFFDKVTNRLFFKDVYNADEFYAKLNKVLTSTTDLSTLLRRVSTLIAQTLKTEQAQFFIHLTPRKYIEVGTDKFRRIPQADIHRIADEVKGMVIASDTDLHHIRRIMVSHRLEIIMPLKREDTIIGYFCLGDHVNARFTLRDIRLLRTIGDELVIAIQNALSVQEVKALNANLEQRIVAATKELRASNAQLQRLDEAKDEFISMASHQLRTPLTSIKGYVSMLMEGDVGKVTDEQKHLLQEAFVSSERMVRLIGDFLNVSRLQTGKFVIDKHPVDLAQLVADEIDALGSNASSRNLSFSYKKPKGIPKLMLDENKIQQVIMNFADNAIYYSKEESTIQVTLKKVDGMVEFTVKDSGIGVPEAQQDQLFNKFFRATNARQQRPDGTGVGLFLAKKVIDAHDGEIVFSSKENKGSTFGFRLPIEKLRASGDADKLGN